MNSSVYLSHRRDVSRIMALAVYRALSSSGVNVFLDPDDFISPAAETQIAARSHFVLLLTPAALANTPADDRLTRELNMAQRTGRRITLLLAHGAELDDTVRLPGVRQTSNASVIAIPSDDIQFGVRKLIERLQESGAAENSEAMRDPAGMRKLSRVQRLTPVTAEQIEAEGLFNLALLQVGEGGAVQVRRAAHPTAEVNARVSVGDDVLARNVVRPGRTAGR